MKPMKDRGNLASARNVEWKGDCDDLHFGLTGARCAEDDRASIVRTRFFLITMTFFLFSFSSSRLIALFLSLSSTTTTGNVLSDYTNAGLVMHDERHERLHALRRVYKFGEGDREPWVGRLVEE